MQDKFDKTRQNFQLATRTTSALCLATALLFAGALLGRVNAEKTKPKSATQSSTPTVKKPIAVSQGRAELPPAVSEMRDAIITAARTGNVDELLIPIQWNELPPNFGAASVRDTLAEWKKKSPDGTGRAWLALLINLLEAPYAVIPQGPDVENARIFIWPAFAELPLDKLSPALDVEFHRLFAPDEITRMRKAGGYDGYGLAIGADGTWHAFTKTANPPTKSK